MYCIRHIHELALIMINISNINVKCIQKYNTRVNRNIVIHKKLIGVSMFDLD